MIKKIFLLTIAILAFLLPTLSIAQSGRAPQISGQDANGNTISLSQFRGKVILLKYWANWCGPCRTSFPKTKRLMDKYSSKGLVIFTVGIGGREKDIAFLKSNGYKFSASIFFDRLTSNPLRVRGIPHEFLISKSGDIIFNGHPSRLSDTMIENALSISGSSGESNSNQNTDDGWKGVSQSALGSVDFSKTGSNRILGQIKYNAKGTIYPVVRSNFWGKWKMTRIAMIKSLHGYVEFKFKGKKFFNIMAAGGSLMGRSRCRVKVTLNGKTIKDAFFLNQWWNNYSISKDNPALKNGVNTVRIYNSSVSVPWLYKAWTSLEKPNKTKFF